MSREWFPSKCQSAYAGLRKLCPTCLDTVKKAFSELFVATPPVTEGDLLERLSELNRRARRLLSRCRKCACHHWDGEVRPK